MKKAKYLTMLDRFAANLAGLTDSNGQLQMMRRTAAHLREELQACEIQELQASGISAEPQRGAMETTGQKQARVTLSRRLEGVVEQFRRGYPLHLRQNWTEATRFFQAAQTTLSTSVMFRMLADIGIQLERYPEALALCDEAEQLGTKRNLAWTSELIWLRAVIYGRLNRYAEALAENERATALRETHRLPPLRGLALHRGFLLGNLGKWEAALEAYADGKDLRRTQQLPENMPPVLSVGYCYEELEFSLEPSTALEKTADLLEERGQPPDADLTLHQGASFHSQRAFDREEEVYLNYERQCQQHGVTPCYPVSKELLRARLAQRNPVEAQEAYDSADERRRELELPEDPELVWMLGQVIQLTTKVQLALSKFIQAEALYRRQAMPVPPQLLFEQALSYGALFNKEAMCQTARKALDAYHHQDVEAPDTLLDMLNECSEA